MIDYRHPHRGNSRTVPAGSPVVLRRGESVSLTPRPDGSRIITRSSR